VKRSSLEKKTESGGNAVAGTGEKCSSAVLEEFFVASNEGNKLLKEQHELIPADSTSNTKGKKQQVYKDAL
jgi:hypothetical protein